MSHRALTLIFLLAADHCPSTKSAPPSEVARMTAQSDASSPPPAAPSLPLPGAPPSSYSQPYGSSLRSSRIAAASRRYTGLLRVQVGWPPSATGSPLTPESERVTPRFVLVPPDAAHLAVDWGARFDTRSADGSCMHTGVKSAYFDLSVFDRAVTIYGNELQWNGESGLTPKVTTGFSLAGSILAMRYDGPRRVIAVQNSPDLPHGGGGWFTEVYQDELTGPDHRAAMPVAIDYFQAKAVAAIAGDFRTVLATEDRTLRILAGEADPTTGKALERLRMGLPYTVRLLSIAPPYVLAVGDDAGGTALHCLDASGTERWSSPLPFARGDEPPLDLGDGTVAVAGMGIATFREGKVLWSAPSGRPVHATAFEDGTLAMASGSELRIVDRNGAIRQVLRTSEGETLSTPPAIAHDGSVWVATEKALYVAR
jgi:hypothetical protein